MKQEELFFRKITLFTAILSNPFQFSLTIFSKRRSNKTKSHLIGSRSLHVGFVRIMLIIRNLVGSKFYLIYHLGNPDCEFYAKGKQKFLVLAQFLRLPVTNLKTFCLDKYYLHRSLLFNFGTCKKKQ